MAQKNRYLFRGRISERKFRDLTRLFALDITADRAAVLTGLNHKTAAAIFTLLRLRLVELAQVGCPFRGQVEIDESYFGPARARRRQQDAGLRHSRTGRSRALPDREKLFESNASGDHRGACGTLGRDHHGRLSKLRRPGRSGVRTAPPDQQIRRSGQARLFRAGRPYQRHRELLELCQTPPPEVQRVAESQLSDLPQGDRIPLQRTQSGPLQDPARIVQNETAQTLSWNRPLFYTISL